MKSRPGRRNEVFNKISRRLFLQRKKIYHFLKPRIDKKDILFVIGCQRSGTSLMLDIFERDLNTKIYDEFSNVSSDDVDKIRLNPLDKVKGEIQKNRTSFVILKPLVESQNILKLLEYFDGSRALWMYRDYKAVAASNLTYFGIQNGINNLRPIVENDPGNWRSERVSENVREIVLRYFSEDMNPYDAGVLFWFVRNSLFFDLGLAENPTVLMCKFEDLVMSSVKIMSDIYSRLGRIFPGERITSLIHSRALKRGKNITVSPEVDRLARELQNKLDQAYEMKNS